MLKATSIHYRAGKKTILDGLTASFKPNTCNIILGPNGSGKSTFLKICSGELIPGEGHVSYDDKDISREKKDDLAMYRAVLSQQPDLHFPLQVEEVVMMGRYPHMALDPKPRDMRICEQVMTALDLGPLRNRNYLTLSGGEKQRVQYARVLSQVWEHPVAGNRFLFLDEPLNSLDIRYQQEFLRLAESFLDERTVFVAVLHDINLAAQFGEQLYFMKDGKIAAAGAPNEILTPEVIKEIFDVEASVLHHPHNGKPVIIYG